MQDKSIWESMRRGEIYNAAHPYLIERLEETRELLHEFNLLPPSRKEELRAILHRLVGAHGENFHFNQPFRCDYGTNIYIGENFFANFNLTILDEAEVRIGDNCFIGPNVSIYTACHPIETEPRNQLLEWAEPVTIGNNVWIGGSTTILPGVSIGDDVVIGAGTVVTKDIPSRSVAVGNPARIIRHID